jgi:hypothetical protein
MNEPSNLVGFMRLCGIPFRPWEETRLEISSIVVEEKTAYLTEKLEDQRTKL